MTPKVSQSPTNDSSTNEADAPSQPATPSSNDEPVVRRRRSSQRPRRSKAKRLSSEKREQKLKRRLEIKVFLIAVPTLLLIVGGVLWVLSHSDPDPSMHPKELIRLSYSMLAIGLSVGIAALLTDWTRKLTKIQKEKREQAAENATLKRRRSTHRRHRSQ